MKKIIFLFVIIGLIASCTSSRKVQGNKMSNPITSVNSEKDGSSYKNAVVLKEKSEQAGVNAEYAWLNKYYPGYKLKLQSLNYSKKKPFDIMSIVTSDGIEKDIYFDISNFYGKF